MVSTDPVADMFSRIRNAIMVNKPVVSMPHSKLKETIAKELATLNFIDEVAIEDNDNKKQLVITINRDGTNPRITKIERVSRPGRRVYAKVDEIPRVKNGRGAVLVSTSRGIMNGFDAKKHQVGGELICKVY